MAAIGGAPPDLRASLVAAAAPVIAALSASTTVALVNLRRAWGAPQVADLA